MTGVRLLRQLLYAFALSLLLTLSASICILNSQPSYLNILITGPASLLPQLEQGFVKNLSSSLLRDVRFIRVELSTLLRNLLDQSTYLTNYDLVVAPSSAPATILESLANHLKSLANLADIRLAIIDAGLVYVTLHRETSVLEELVGAEVPWQRDFVVSIATDPSRGKFHTALSFLQAMGQNVFVFVLGGETISVKSLLLENKTSKLAFGVHLEFDREPRAAAAAGRQDWSCQVKDKKVICKTAVDSLPKEGRLAVGAAFVGAPPGIVKNCLWTDKFELFIDYC